MGPETIICPAPSSDYRLILRFLLYPSTTFGDIDMPSGYSTKCKTCNSHIRLEIESWHVKEGKDFITISLKLRERGIEISDRAIAAHFNNHYNIQKEAKEQYILSQEQIKEDVAIRLSDLEILDGLIQGNNIIHIGLRKQITDLQNKFSVPMPAVTMLNGVSDSICKAMKTKQELLGETTGDKMVSVIESLSEAELNARIATLIPISED
jgi:hypothetical protein